MTKSVKVCFHCREQHWHKDGCLFYVARVRLARDVLGNEATFELTDEASFERVCPRCSRPPHHTTHWQGRPVCIGVMRPNGDPR